MEKLRYVVYQIVCKAKFTAWHEKVCTECSYVKGYFWWNKYQYNKALLSQAEIDTLIRFLTSHNESVEDSILSQESIDKVIKLLNEKDIHTGKYKFTTASKKSADDLFVLIDVDLKGYILDATVDENTHFIKLSAYNEKINKRVPITPTAVQYLHLVEDTSSWGFCIEPILFNNIARIFHIQYYQKTYDFICHTFAQHHFGDKNVPIPYIYLPNSENLIDTMIL